MTSGWRGPALAALLSLGAFFPSADGVASDPPPPLDPTATEAERGLLAHLDGEEYLTARREAEELLESDPDSIIARYVLGRVLHVAEGDLPRAMRELGRARELFEKRHPASENPDNWRLHQQILDSTAWLALELEEFEFQLQILDYHDVLYSPVSAGEHAWPLMRLGDFGRAREYAELAKKSKQPWQRALGYNALCAVEGEAQRRDAQFEACRDGLEHKRRLPKSEPVRATLAIDFYNTALAARAVFRPDEAEKLLLEGARHFAPTNANPWRLLVELRLAAGRAGDALAALREMQSWRRRTPANVRGQDRAKTDSVAATVFLLANETERGMALADGLLAFPDRRGLSTSNAMQALGGHALLRLALRRSQRHRDAERTSLGEPRIEGRLARVFAKVDSWAEDWADEERVVKATSSERVLVSTLRPHMPGGLDDVPTWLVGDLVNVVGAGIVLAALEEARALDPGDAARGYFDAYEAEASLEAGNEARAYDLARRALDTLPPSEALLRARTAAVAYLAAREEELDAMPYLEQALTLDGGVFRRLGIALPARVELPDDELGRALGSLLEDSPSLSLDDEGPVIRLGGGDDVALCLHGPVSGAALVCGRTPRAKNPDAEPITIAERARGLVKALYDDGFAVPLGLTGTDVSSLDGSTTTSEAAVREKLQKLLEDEPDMGKPE